MEAPAGAWKISLRNRNTSKAAGFHAWVQRDDAAPGRLRGAKGNRGRQSYLLDGEGAPVDPCFTLNGIATAVHRDRRLWVMGAMDEAGRLSRCTAAGPDRDVGDRIEGPDVVMKVDRSRNQPGRLVGGTLTGSRVRLAGTSIGAAVFTRMLLQHVLATAGPGRPVQWAPAPPCPPPTPPLAGEPKVAADIVRGRDRKLPRLEALVLPARR